jgi:prolyl-tRNA editing enzyme YbaK/EbsC (Cys-tRNA(Pro) deacylase)
VAGLRGSARKVQEALFASGIDSRVQELPDSTRTAREAAEAIGCRVGQIAKSLVFKGVESGRPVLVIASGANRVDEALLSEAVGERVAIADADFARQQTGFAIGGVPPVGHIQEIPTYVDEDLLAFEEIWAAAGTPHAVFPLKPEDLLAITSGHRLVVQGR